MEQVIYLTLWILVLGIPPINLLLQNSEAMGEINFKEDVLRVWIAESPFLLLFLVNNYILIPLLLLKKNYAGYAMVIILIIPLLFIIVPEAIRIFGPEPMEREGMMPPAMVPPHPPGDSLRMHPERSAPSFVTFMHIVVAMLLIGFNVAIKLFLKSLHDDEHLKELNHQRLKAELQYLKYQLNPHFFMNTLNNIHALVDIDTDKAKKSIIELSKLMRYMLYEADKNSILLSKEIQFLQHYLTLMQLRYTGKLSIRTDFPLIVPDIQVPPLLFISLVENAFKHGVSYLSESFIDIRISIEEQKVHFSCRNSIHSKQEKVSGEGIGLPNVRKRLNLLFGTDYTLDTQEDNNEYHALLIIPAL